MVLLREARAGLDLDAATPEAVGQLRWLAWAEKMTALRDRLAAVGDKSGADQIDLLLFPPELGERA